MAGVSPREVGNWRGLVQGRPAALAASPCPQRAALQERGEGAQRLRGGYPILQPAPLSASALAATPITLFSLFSTWRR